MEILDINQISPCEFTSIFEYLHLQSIDNLKNKNLKLFKSVHNKNYHKISCFTKYLIKDSITVVLV